MRTRAMRLVVAVAALVALAQNVTAGQVFVSVGSPGFSFSPKAASVLGHGDFVIWTWVASSHTVTSGTSGSVAGDGIFNSDPGGLTHGIGTVFAWKTDREGSIPYYCRLDFVTHNMKGSISVPGPGNPVADFRITEVRFDGVGSNFVEISNLGGADGDLQAFRLSISGAAFVTPWNTSTPLPAGGRIVVSEPAGLTNQGSAALFAPYLAGSVPGTGLATDASMIVDYVEWGPNGGQPLEDTAVQVILPATLWLAGEFAPQAQAGHSIVFCGTPFDHTSVYWNESLNPTPGLFNDCVNPARHHSWGQLKTLYR